MASPELISQATAFVSKWPKCVVSSYISMFQGQNSHRSTVQEPDLIKGFVASNCGSNINCICDNETFRLLVIAGTRQSCALADANSMSLFSTIGQSRRS